MVEIAMGKAGELMGMAPRSARRALQREGYKLRELSARSFVVEEDDVKKYVEIHGVSKGRGRRVGDKSKPKSKENEDTP